MKGNTKKAIRQTLAVTAALCGIFVLVSILTFKQSDSRFKLSVPMVSDKVWDYKPLVEKYAKQFEIEEHVDVLLAMMMQESGGRGNDPMQSSESYCGEPGCIKDPELSIKQGVYYFSQTIEEANGDVKLAIQSYNFGKGFIDYVNRNSGTYSREIAINFSQKMYKSADNKSIYTCLREEAEKYNACYGDIYYVRDVMEFKQAITTKS